MLNRRISLKRFKKLIMETVKNKPSNIRYGQCVFNFIDENFHVARQIQMEDNIDCFYDDTKVPLFIMNAWYRYNGNNNFSRTRLYSEHGHIDVFYTLKLHDNSATLSNLWVDKKYRKNGEGKQLVDMAKEYCHNHNISTISLRVLKKCQWLRIFYKNMGFVESIIDKNPHFIWMTNAPMVTHLLKK